MPRRGRKNTQQGFHRGGAGPKSHKGSIGKGTNAWSSTRRPRTGRRKGGW